MLKACRRIWTADDADAWIEWGGADGVATAAELVAAEPGGASLMTTLAPPRNAAVRLGLFGHDQTVAATVISTRAPGVGACLVRLVFDHPCPPTFLSAAQDRFRDPHPAAAPAPAGR